MAFFDRDYQVYVILGSPDLAEIWYRHRWQKVADLLSPFATVPRGKAALRGNKLVPNPAKPGYYMDRGLGRLGWDQRSHEKWTFVQGASGSELPDWKLTYIEAWSPSWTVCERENTAPDFLFSLDCQRNSRFLQAISFDPVIVLAASTTLGEKYLSDFRYAAISVAKHVDSRIVVSCVRPWGYAWGSSAIGAFGGALNDIIHSGLFKVGDPHQRPIGLDTFIGEWTFVPT